MVSNHIIHHFPVVNSLRYPLELLSNEKKTTIWKFRISLVIGIEDIFLIFRVRKMYQKIIFMLPQLEGSFFTFIPARKNRNFLISMLIQERASVRPKIRKIRKIRKILANIQNTEPFYFHIIESTFILRSISDNRTSSLIDRSPQTNPIINLKK